MRALPAPVAPPIPARHGSVQRSDRPPSSVVLQRGRGTSTQAMTAEYLRHYQDWQEWAKRYARQLGIVRFAAGLTADTIMRVIPRVEELNDSAEWVETQDPRLIGLIEEYRNARQTHIELLREHAWHYQVAGECLQVMRNLPSGLEWSIYSTKAVDWDRPQKGDVTVRDVPEGREVDGTAFVVPREYVERFWIPDEEWKAYATSPMAASIEDLHRLRALARYAWNTADSALAMNGLVWMPDDDWIEAPPLETEETSDVGTPASTPEDNYYEIARLRMSESDDITAVAPHLVHWEGKLGKPEYVRLSEALDPNGIAYRTEAKEDFGRGTNLPAALVSGGGPADKNHWTEWLIDDKFFDQAVGPTANRIFHVDLTSTFLEPRLRIANYDVRRYRMGYDPTPVIVAADKSERALKMYQAGLISEDACREAGGFDESDAMTDANEFKRLLDILARGREFGQPAPTIPGAPGPAQSPLGPPPGSGTSSAPAPPTVAAMLAHALTHASRNGD